MFAARCGFAGWAQAPALPSSRRVRPKIAWFPEELPQAWGVAGLGRLSLGKVFFAGGAFKEGEGAWSGNKNCMWWQLILLRPAVAAIRNVGYFVISVMALSPFVTASAEWYNWAGGQILAMLFSNNQKGEGIANNCCVPFSMQWDLFPSVVLAGVLLVFKCPALSLPTVFATCLVCQ